MQKNKKSIIICKVIAFVLIVGIIFSYINNFFQTNDYLNNSNIYDEPKNTIDTVFLGSSMTMLGISSMELYDKYGICSYNVGSLGQPVMASYYWLEEVYKLQADTLKTVVFDVSRLRTEMDEYTFVMSTEIMQMTETKFKMLYDYTEDFNKALSYFVPVFFYHDKVSSLETDDFVDMNYAINIRGQYFLTDQLVDTVGENSDSEVVYELDTNAEPISLDEESLEYFYKMVSFCKENSLELILIKTPNPEDWSSGAHNAISELAQKDNLTFIDFNYEPYLSEMSYEHLYDSVDGIHLNHYGAKKLSIWMGNYLIQNNYSADVKGDPRYAYMDQQLEEYHDFLDCKLNLDECQNLLEYISFASRCEEYVVFITVKDEAATKLTNAQREKFGEIGLTKLQNLKVGDSYLAVIDEGNVIFELADSCKADESNLWIPINYKGELDTGYVFDITSGGKSLGNVASCKIENVEYALNKRGINFVVYDKKANRVMNSTVFDTYSFSYDDLDDAELQ